MESGAVWVVARLATAEDTDGEVSNEEMQVNNGKVVRIDEALRTFVEDCVRLLRIKNFKTRVAEQLRVQFPPPNKVTWKDLEAIVEVQDKLKNDAESWILTFLQEITRRCGCQYSCWEAGQHELDLRAIKDSIKKVDAVADGRHGDTENKKRADTPSPSKKIKKEVNAAERAKRQAYNNTPPPTQQPEGGAVKNKPKCLRCFGGGFHDQHPDQCRSGYKHDCEARTGVLYHEGKLGSSKWWEAENAAIGMYNLKNRFKSSDWGILVTDWQQLSNEEKDKYRVAQTPAEKKNPPGKADALKAEYQGMVAARQTASRAGSVRSQVFAEDEGSDEEAAAAGAQTMQGKTEIIAAPAVALGSTQKMRGFPVKTPEEFEAEAQIPLAPAGDEMQRKVQLMASLLKSFNENEEDLESLVSGLDSEDAEVFLDEMPEDVVDQPKRRRTSITVAAAAVQGNYGVEDFSTRGRLHAGTMEAEAYELLKKRMLSGLTEEQITAMAQYKAILLDTGANCNIIPLRTVKQLGLTIFDSETGARVTRCDGSPAEFTKYCYVDVILAADTPCMTLHRLHAVVTSTNDTTWDFLQQGTADTEVMKEDRLALSGERCAFSQDHPELSQLLESFLTEYRVKKFSRDEQRMLDARCKALVEAGVLQPRSVAQTELTGRIRLHAEDLRFTAPEPGTSVTRQLADLLRDQREANVATRGEWNTPEELVTTTPIDAAEKRGPSNLGQGWRWTP
ncbi:hypothetical protein CYMTET_45690 [Cymbomonas tetramitiformis]|uniref:Uncharacterized protein n=1 Tax=Cymbomonas tetramitiformis TaxID=36881 RepID=A0AAE0BZI1_9CHLO|nr:hypothetical protein CYMTET_45690 [Cymbomonas tetramitiformis]